MVSYKALNTYLKNLIRSKCWRETLCDPNISRTFALKQTKNETKR